MKIIDALNWLPSYYAGKIGRGDETLSIAPDGRVHVFVAVCDHFEPYWGKAQDSLARSRIKAWLDNYPKTADRAKDDEGRALPYSFFYPEEEYRPDDMAELASLCAGGYGEVEVHLHHDNDTSENLRKTLVEFKRRLHLEHGLLGADKKTGDIAYGFIHGNWALDNSRKDGRWCGVNDEISVLLQTGCFADFTMPSAPSDTQTKKVNSIYYAVDDPQKPKSHDTGIDARVGRKGEGLLMIQGPLLPAWWSRKYGLLPRIENASLQKGMKIHEARVSAWLDARVEVKGAPGYRFVKLHAHGAQDEAIRYFFDDGNFLRMLEILKDVCRWRNYFLHFVSAREMANAALALTSGLRPTDKPEWRDYRYGPPPLFAQTSASGAK